MKCGRRHPNAFSLPEILVVIGIAGVLLSLVAGSLSRHNDREASREAARRFAWLVEEAQTMARTGRTPVRLVFIPRRLSSGEDSEGDNSIVECRLYRFVVPAAAQPEVVWRTPGTQHAERGGDALERIPSAPPGLPECLVGQWESVTMKPMRLVTNAGEELILESPLLDRFKAQTIEEYAAENAWRPPQYWSELPADETKLSARSIYPLDYAKTPFPVGYLLVRQSLPADAKVYDPQSGDWRPVAEYWGSSPVEHYNLSGAGLLKENLPFLEFDGRGECQSRWTGNLNFMISLPRRPDVMTEVVLSQETGIARVKNPEPVK